jgi:hypothetical protein
MPAGNESLTAIPSISAALGLVIVKVKVDVALSATVDGAKALVIVGGGTTVNVAEAVPLLPALVEVTGPVTLL